MGTRGLVIIQTEKEKIGLYNHYDSYPEGIGVEIIDILKDNYDEFKYNTRYYTGKQGLPKDFYIRTSNAVVILNKIINHNPTKHILVGLENEINFAYDSLFCEWAYLIDTTKNQYRVFKGFNNQPLPSDAEFHGEENVGYYPIKLYKTYQFKRLFNVDYEKWFKNL